MSTLSFDSTAKQLFVGFPDFMGLFKSQCINHTDDKKKCCYSFEKAFKSLGRSANCNVEGTKNDIQKIHSRPTGSWSIWSLQIVPFSHAEGETSEHK